MKKKLLEAGYSSDLINQQGVEVLYRGHLAQKKKGILRQMRSLLCDADSQDPRGAVEDLKDLQRD